MVHKNKKKSQKFLKYFLVILLHIIMSVLTAYSFLVNNGIIIENITIYHIILNTTTATSIGSINELIRHSRLLFC